MRTLRNLPWATVAGAGGFWFMLAQVVVGSSNLVFHVLVSRLLGPAAYGAFGSLLALAVLMTVPAVGIQTLVTARTAQIVETGQPADGRVLFARALAIGALCSTAMLTAAPWIRTLLQLDSVWPVLWLALYCLPLAASVVPWGMLCGQRRFGTVGAITVGATVLRAAFAVAFIEAGLGVAGAIGASLVADTLQAFALLLAGGRLRPRPATSTAVPLRIDARAAGAGVIAFVGLWLFAGIDTIIARLLFDEVSAGLYSAAATALHGALYAGQAITLVALPALAATDPGRARRTLHWTLLAVGAITVPVVAVLAGAGPWLIPLVFGPTFEVALDVLVPVAVATTGIALLWVLVQYSIAQARRGAFAAWFGLPVAVLVAALWPERMWHLAAAMIIALVPPLALAVRSAYRRRTFDVAAGQGPLPQPTRPLDLTVVVPFYNPGPALRSNLLRLVGELRGYGVSFEVVAVDDGSTDGSAQCVADLDDDGVLRLLRLPHNQGKGSALRHGLCAGNGRYLGFIDADGDLDPTLWRSFIELIKLYEPDGIVGDKRHPLTALDSAASWTRNVCSYGYRSLVRLLFPALPVRDTQVGLKVFRRELLADVLPHCTERRFVLDVEILALATRLGYRRILAAPISLYRVDRTTVTPRALIQIFLDTLRLAGRFHVLDSYRAARRTSPAAARVVPQAEPDRRPATLTEAV